AAVLALAGRLRPDSGLLTARPFRAPHHTISEAGLVGGGSIPRPGEVSLAHRGVLFLDELPEFGRRVLEVLRQPLEEGVVYLVRARAAVTFPSRFTLVAALNPCPCGYQGDGTERCTCDPARVERYLGRVSGPVLDRIDLHLDVPAVRWREITEATTGESSAAVRARVREARERAARRLRGGASNSAGPGPGASGSGAGADAGAEDAAPKLRTTGITCNAEMGPAEIRAHCALDRVGEAFLREAVERFGLSARGYHRTLKVARTIADLAGRERIEAAHVAEAVGYRLPGWGGG
ncbi:MAG: ATP-binding protein, partial [Gemmatimonadota bacterium]